MKMKINSDAYFSRSNYTLPFNQLDNNDWLLVNEMRPKITSHVVNVISTEDRKFASNTVNTEISNDEVLLDHVNSKYYDIKKLNSTKIDIPSSFGLFHANIASLNLHIDDLKHILSLLNLILLVYQSTALERIHHHLTIYLYLAIMNLSMNLLRPHIFLKKKKKIRSLVNINKFKSSSINLLNENGNLVSDPKKIPNVFNQYFSTIGPEIEF